MKNYVAKQLSLIGYNKSRLFNDLRTVTIPSQVNKPRSRKSKLTDSRWAKGPAGVYIAWRGRDALYIGYGKDVVARAEHRCGRPRTRLIAFAESDRVEIFLCDSVKQAQQLEVELIGIYNPRYNFVGHFQSSRSFQMLQAAHSLLEVRA